LEDQKDGGRDTANAAAPRDGEMPVLASHLVLVLAFLPKEVIHHEVYVQAVVLHDAGYGQEVKIVGLKQKNSGY